MTVPYITPAHYNPSPRHSPTGANPMACLHHVILHNLSRHSRVGGNPTPSLHHVILHNLSRHSHNPSRHSHNPPRHSRVGGNPTPSLIQNVSARGTDPDAVDNSEL